MIHAHINTFRTCATALLLIWCVSCVNLRTNPAKQTTESNNPHMAQRSMLVEHVDIDQDGTISAEESRSLMGDQPGVLITFAMIVGSVMFASIASAWASSRWKPKPHTTTTTPTMSAHEPLEPHQHT